MITIDYCLKIILDKKMGCFCLISDEPKTRTYDCTSPGDNFECLRPQGTINLSIDRKYNIPIVENLMAGMKIVFIFGQR